MKRLAGFRFATSLILKLYCMNGFVVLLFLFFTNKFKYHFCIPFAGHLYLKTFYKYVCRKIIIDNERIKHFITKTLVFCHRFRFIHKMIKIYSQILGQFLSNFNI